MGEAAGTQTQGVMDLSQREAQRKRLAMPGVDAGQSEGLPGGGGHIPAGA